MGGGDESRWQGTGSDVMTDSDLRRESKSRQEFFSNMSWGRSWCQSDDTKSRRHRMEQGVDVSGMLLEENEVAHTPVRPNTTTPADPSVAGCGVGEMLEGWK